MLGGDFVLPNIAAIY